MEIQPLEEFGLILRKITVSTLQRMKTGSIQLLWEYIIL
jgi:hypothetical protein